MRRILRLILQICLPLLAGVAGCGFPVARGDYGMEVPPLPHDPRLLLEDFSYLPASPIHVGDTLSFSVKTNRATNAGYLTVRIGSLSHDPLWASLNDDGYAPDDAASDGLWHGSLPWVAQLGQADGLPVVAELSWADGAPGQQLDGPSLTVLPAEGGAI